MKDEQLCIKSRLSAKGFRVWFVDRSFRPEKENPRSHTNQHEYKTFRLE